MFFCSEELTAVCILAVRGDKDDTISVTTKWCYPRLAYGFIYQGKKGGGRIRRQWITTADNTIRIYLVGRHFDSPNYSFLSYFGDCEDVNNQWNVKLTMSILYQIYWLIDPLLFKIWLSWLIMWIFIAYMFVDVLQGGSCMYINVQIIILHPVYWFVHYFLSPIYRFFSFFNYCIQNVCVGFTRNFIFICLFVCL